MGALPTPAPPSTTTTTTSLERSHFEAFSLQNIPSTTTQSKWAAAATPTAPARAAPALRAPAPAANKQILSPTDLSVTSSASTTMSQHHLGVHHRFHLGNMWAECGSIREAQWIACRNGLKGEST